LIVNTVLLYLARVWVKVPASNWNIPRPPCWSAQGPSPAPAITGPPPQSPEFGPLQAQVASDQQWARPVSA
jgi:hypothetical protein